MFKKVDLRLRTNNTKWAEPEQRVTEPGAVHADASVLAMINNLIKDAKRVTWQTRLFFWSESETKVEYLLLALQLIHNIRIWIISSENKRVVQVFRLGLINRNILKRICSSHT